LRDLTDDGRLTPAYVRPVSERDLAAPGDDGRGDEGLISRIWKDADPPPAPVEPAAPSDEEAEEG
jgi:hypothetical protein